MADKKADKSPYKSHSVEEIMQTEAGNYYIQIGDSLFESEYGKIAFSKDRADHFFSVVWQGLRDMKESGDAEEKKEAEYCLLHFRIIPLRFH
jgi:hypothetical protein